jgi:small subunit ribosomal protein S1
MLKNRELVNEKADEMAEIFRQKRLAEAQGIPYEPDSGDSGDLSATETDQELVAVGGADE